MAYHCPLVKSTFTCNAELGTFLVGFTIRKSTIETETSESGTCNLERATWELQYANQEMEIGHRTDDESHKFAGSFRPSAC